MTIDSLELKIPPVALVFGFALVMYALTLIITTMNFTWSLSQMIALLIVSLSSVLVLVAIFQFKQRQTTVNPMKPSAASNLVTNGVFRISRNPMYLAMLGTLLAWGFWLQNVGALIVLWLFVPYMNRFQIKPEETAMKKVFGEEYSHYCAQVRRWL